MAIITAPADLAKATPTQSEQPVTTEATESTIEATAPKEEALSPKFAALARKEKALRAQAQAIKAREEAFKASEATYSQKYVDKEKLKSNPMEVLSELGLSYDDLTNLVLNSNSTQSPEISELKKELQALKDEQLQIKTGAQKSQEAAYEQALTQIRNEAKLLVDSNEAYETIKETNNYEAVVELIKETFDSEGTLLTVEDAATQVEEYLMENALKMAQLRKIKAKLNPPAKPEEEKQQAPQKQQPQMKTLTSAVSAQTTRGHSEKERIARAMLAFQGKLN